MQSPLRQPHRASPEARVAIRPVVAGDAAETAALMDAEVAAGLISWSSPMSERDALDRIVRSQAALADGSAVDFAVLAAADDRLLGWVGLWREGEVLALGYWLGTRFQGQGLITEALRLAIPAGHALLGETTVIARVRPSNPASIRVLDRIGFVFAKAADDLLEYRLEF